MKIEVSYITHRGKVRDNNEDSILILNKVIQVEEMQMPVVKEINDNCAIFAVADGMGGYNAGEIASRMVLETLANNWRFLKSTDEIEKFFQEVNDKLIKYGEEHPEINGLGSTIAGILILEDRGIVFNIGDSRVYRVNAGYLEQLSKDQSLVQELIKLGIITEEEARFHPQRHIILESIGGKNNKKNISVILKEIKLREDDMFLICSDGLYDDLNIDEMENSLKDDIRESIENLFKSVIDRGANDNISIILIKIEKENNK
jgi:protein phosphatase